MKEENPSLKPAELSSRIAEVYRNMGEDKLKKYKNAAAKALKEYNAKMKSYN